MTRWMEHVEEEEDGLVRHDEEVGGVGDAPQECENRFAVTQEFDSELGQT